MVRGEILAGGGTGRSEAGGEEGQGSPCARSCADDDEEAA